MTDQELKGHFEGISKQFEAMNQRFDGMDQRFDATDHRLDETNARLERVEDTVRRVDVEVHRQGILADEYRGELRLATEQFQTLQHVTNTKIDNLRDAVDRRLVPLELTVRSHSDMLARHDRHIAREDAS